MPLLADFRCFYCLFVPLLPFYSLTVQNGALFIGSQGKESIPTLLIERTCGNIYRWILDQEIAQNEKHSVFNVK